MFKIHLKDHLSCYTCIKLKNTSMRGYIRKNLNFILIRDKVIIKYISDEQSSIIELAFRIKLNLNLHFKILRNCMSGKYDIIGK